LALSQDYLWPVKAKKELTAVFGEERPGRYHTGIDVRTFGDIGYHLVAIDDGYISRIRTSSKGYGKTLYLKLNDGNTAVYAHLDHFTPELDNLVNALHQHYGKYTINHKLEPNDYSVIKGELIGYSGDTGGVSGPHLHFEIRDIDDQPINPFQKSLDIPDNLHPEVEFLAVIPLDDQAKIDGFQEQKIYQLQKINEEEYVLPDTIFVSGNIGLGVKAIDKITGQYFNFGIYSANLLLDAEFIYSMQYSKINWENASEIYTERNYSLARSGFGKFYHLFSHHENQKLPFINIKSKAGYYFNQKILHDAIIDISDYANNKVEIHGYFVSDTLPHYNYTTKFKNNDCYVTFIDHDFVRPYFYLTGPDLESQVIPAIYLEMDNNVFWIKNLMPPLNVLQISAKNQAGISSPPTFHMKPQQDFENIEGEFIIKHYEHGIIISFEEKLFTGIEAYLSLKRAGILFTYNLHRDSKLTLSSDLLSPMDFEDVTEIKVYYKSATPYEIFSMNLSGSVAYPDSSFYIDLLDNQLTMSGTAGTFYDTVYIWAQPITTSLPNEGEILSGPYYVKPYLIPFNNEIQLSIAIEPIHSIKPIAIYYYNQKKFEWQYLSSQLSTDSLYMTASILSGEIFAVIEENNPPEFSDFIPDINGTYYSSDLEHISFYVQDTFSGLEGETDVIVKIDDNPVIFEYNSYQKKIRYPLKYNLKKGMHTLYVQASDRVGNRSIVKGDFYIK
jgi:hypothetical protein